MDGEPTSNITMLLAQWGQGDRSALDRLTPLVRDELLRIATSHMRRERPGHTLQPTALVHEAYLHLVGGAGGEFHDRRHFYAVCAQIMRHILVDHARAQARDKRGGGALRVTLHEDDLAAREPEADLLVLDRALDMLDQFDEQKSRLIELRYFGGLTLKETAEVLKVSEMTVRREWRRAKAWLYRFMTERDAE